MTDEDLRRAYAAAGPSDHPDDDAWERLATGQLDSAEAESLKDHAVRCADCGRVWKGLRALAAEAGAFDSAVPPTAMRTASGRAGRKVTRWAWGGLAAAAALAAWAIVRPVGAPQPPTEAETVRSASDAQRPQPIAPVGRVTGTPAAFLWQPIRDARFYRVRVLGAEGEALWTSDAMAGTSVAWPSALEPRPGRYVWMVIAGHQPTPTADDVASTPVEFEIGR